MAFAANPGQPLFSQGMFSIDPNSTPDQIATRRALMAALRPRYGSAKYIGEGLGQLATGLVEGHQSRQMRDIEGEERQQADALFAGLLGGATGGERAASGQQPMNILGVNPGYGSEAEKIGQETMAAIGQPSNAGGYRESIIGTESGGNFGARNNEVGSGGRRGHIGRVQFGQDRFADAVAAGVIPQGMTFDQFGTDTPEGRAAQLAAEDWHFDDLERQLAPYVGTVVNGKPLDMGALVAMGHLGGAAGARRFVETGGQYNPSDSFGTSLADYAATHGGQGGGAARNPVTPQIPADQLIAAMTNPWLSAEQRGMLQTIYDQQVSQNGPMAAIELERAQLELDQLRNPQATPVEAPAGFTSLDMQARAAGYEPGTPEYKEWMRTGGGGGVPAAFTALDLQAQAAGFVPGTPEYQEFMATRGAGLAAAAKTEGEAQAEAQIAAPGDIATAETTLGYIDSIRNHPGRSAGSGATSFLGAIPGSGAKEFQIEVERLKSGAFLTAIEQLRGMGALSNAEGQTATAAVAALDPSGSEEGFLKRLAEYEAIVQRGMERARARVSGELPSGTATPPPGQILTYNPDTGDFE